ncbi:MAG: endonuclease/exonuclease/phosphatase family protein, partial [Solirubrobacteraceae bacterium]
VLEHRWRRLCVCPERRWVHGVRLRHAGVWVANLHGGGPMRDAVRAAESVVGWAGPGMPAVLGGDVNIRDLALDGFDYAGGHDVDLVFARGLMPAAETEVLDRGPLSDHAPVAVTLVPAPRSPESPST